MTTEINQPIVLQIPDKGFSLTGVEFRRGNELVALVYVNDMSSHKMGRQLLVYKDKDDNPFLQVDLESKVR